MISSAEPDTRDRDQGCVGHGPTRCNLSFLFLITLNLDLPSRHYFLLTTGVPYTISVATMRSPEKTVLCTICLLIRKYDPTKSETGNLTLRLVLFLTKITFMSSYYNALTQWQVTELAVCLFDRWLHGLWQFDFEMGGRNVLISTRNKQNLQMLLK